MVRVCALIVNYDGERLLGACLESVATCLARHAGPTRLLVADNGSTDGSVDLVRRDFPTAEVLELGANRGFAGGVNAGVAASDEEWLLLVNTDMEIAPDALERMLAAVDGPDVGAVGAQIVFAADPGTINSAGIEVDVLEVEEEGLVEAADVVEHRPPVERGAGSDAEHLLSARARLGHRPTD